MSRQTLLASVLSLFMVVLAAGSAQAQGGDVDALSRQVVSLLDQGKPNEALPVAQRAVALARQLYGDNDLRTAKTLGNLGAVAGQLGAFDQGLPLLAQALKIRERLLEPDHEDVALSLNNLAFFLQRLGRANDAEPLYKRSLAIKEKVYGLDHPEVGSALKNLGLLYRAQRRFKEAEPALKRALAILEKKPGPPDLSVAQAVNSLAALYLDLNRNDEAGPLLERSLKIREDVLGPNHPAVATALDNLASYYRTQGLFSDAEPLIKRAIDIYTRAYGSKHPDVTIARNNLLTLYQQQGRDEDLEAFLRERIETTERTLGGSHPELAEALDTLARRYFARGAVREAADLWRRSTAIVAELTLRDADKIGKPLAVGGEKANVISSDHFLNLVRALYRLAEKDGDPDNAIAREAFVAAQWARNSEAGASLAQMAARAAGGDPALAALIRERGSLLEQWRELDAERTATASRPADQRNLTAEASTAKRISDIDARIAEIDRRLTADFKDYSAFSSPEPIKLEEVQSLLSPDEALVLFLDSGNRPMHRQDPPEIFTWVATKDGLRWSHSEFKPPKKLHVKLGKGTFSHKGEGLQQFSGFELPALGGAVEMLRCGLDNALWSDPKRCTELLELDGAPKDGAPLPFDLARATSLYKALFGELEEAINGKTLLIVPSGPLTQLPFQVLVKTLPGNVTAGAYKDDRTVLGMSFEPLNQKYRQSKRWRGKGGVVVSRAGIGGLIAERLGISTDPDNPAVKAGVESGDILYRINGRTVDDPGQATSVFSGQGPGFSARLELWRDGRQVTTTMALAKVTYDGWRPLYLDAVEPKSVHWLIRDHATAILPAASSLKALRRIARPSSASKPLVGFANPLLDGPGPQYASVAREARQKQACSQIEGRHVADRRGAHRGVPPVELKSGLTDVAEIRKLAPLPETADEICAVARDIGADASEMRLGDRATEREVKNMSESGALSRYRIVHFATHGAMAGEMESNAEPGLILTPPEKPTEADDGYLTGTEIAGLKLDADWVILSACNTAAGEVQNAEALSGLARAFFYAQARALLVSHWAVYSDATVALITSAMGEIVKGGAGKSIGRAEALRRAMISLIDSGHADQSHPAYWAPFVVVGEGVR